MYLATEDTCSLQAFFMLVSFIVVDVSVGAKVDDDGHYDVDAEPFVDVIFLAAIAALYLTSY